MSSQLVLHGSLILMASLIYGAPYARAIKANAPAQVTNSWRVAHQSLAVGALLLFALAAIQAQLLAPVWLVLPMNMLFVVSAYAFAVSTPMAALTRDRGLQAGATGWARVVYVGNLLGALTSLIGGALLVLSAAWTVLGS